MWHDEKKVYIEFSDNGIGIRGEDFGKIFDPFFSTKGVWGSSKEKGTGLGLSISANIIKNHGGEILAKSAMGIGTEFTVVLPASPILSSNPNFDLSGMGKILVVEFDPEQASHLAEIIRGFGGDPRVYQWSDELVAGADPLDYDLAIIDAAHPAVMDFVRLIEYLKATRPTVPIILSSFGPIKHQFDDYVDLANAILNKPFTKDNVAAAVKIATLNKPVISVAVR